MSKKTPEERYADIVTRGMWILPRRRREARREVLEHLEDAAESKGVQQWTDETLRKEIGPPKKLRKMFINGGLPWWARIAKWGAAFALFVIALIIGLDLCTLWFYPVPNVWIKTVLDDPAYLDRLGDAFMPTEPGIKWQEQGDDQSDKAIQAILDAQALITKHHQTIKEAENQFLEEIDQLAASQGIVGATRQQQIQNYWAKFQQEFYSNMPGAASSPMMMGMGKGVDLKEAEPMWLHDYAKQNGNAFVQPPLLREDFLKILDAWNSVGQFDHLHFKKPAVTPEDIEYAKKIYEMVKSGNINKDTVWPKQPTPGLWGNTALSAIPVAARYGKKVSYDGFIQTTKDLFATRDFMMAFNTVSQTVRDLGPDWARPASETIYVATPDRITAEQAPKLIQSTSRWTRHYADAIDPQPEPLIDWLVLVAQMDSVDKMLRGWVHSIDDLPHYQAALEESVAIDYAKIPDKWPGLEDTVKESAYRFDRIRFKDVIAMLLSDRTIFKFQCSAMQLFLPKQSESYARYAALKQLREFQTHTMMNSIAAPNFENARVRTRIAQAQQAIAHGALELTKWIEAGSPIDDWSPPKIDDPFQDDGLKIEVAPDAVEFRSAGPDKAFG
ncbi:hypothetical protein K8I31_13200, partial [bacterium]|nr:hypothetical protein [bacterium]